MSDASSSRLLGFGGSVAARGARATIQGGANRCAYIGTADAELFKKELREGLRELGYMEGQNIAFEFRSAEGKLDRLPNSRLNWSGSRSI